MTFIQKAKSEAEKAKEQKDKFQKDAEEEK
jgi:hypothetical protein